MCRAATIRAIIEALALTGALQPESRTGRDAQRRSPTCCMAGSRPTTEGHWSGRDRRARAAIVLERLWRGVTDHHIIEHAFLVSAEARKLACARARAGRDLRRPVDA